MNCFEHPQKPAVGTCMNCGRGLCKECTTTVEGKLSCRGVCQEEVKRERRWMVQSESSLGQRTAIYETQSSLAQRNFAFMFTFGIGCLVFGVMLFVWQIYIFGGVLLVLGILFLTNGVGMARASKKFKNLAAEGRKEGLQS
jgi:hypothetical protein